MIHSGLASDVRALERGKYTAVITITTLKEASYQDKPVNVFKPPDKAGVPFVGMDELTVNLG